MHQWVLGGVRGVFSFVFGVVMALSGVCAAQCEPGWSSWGSTPGSLLYVQQTTVWDHDGDPLTPRRVVIVHERSSNDSTRPILMWDGALWQTIGRADQHLARSMIVWDPDGPGPLPERLVIAARFAESDGTTSHHVAYWGGNDWVRLGPGFNDSVTAIAVWDPDGDGPTSAQLVVGGFFTSIGGDPINRVARWDGTQWVGLGSGMGEGFVSTLVAWDPDGLGPLSERLVAGGTFFTVGGADIRCIGFWDGQSWNPMSLGFNASPAALTVWDSDGDGPGTPDLIVGGHLAITGDGVMVRGVARWDGTRWSALGPVSAPTPYVRSLAVWDPDGEGPMNSRLVVGGYFSGIGGIQASNLAMFDGSQWQAVGSGLNAAVNSLSLWDPDGDGPRPSELVAGGYFRGSADAHVPKIGRWDGTRWQTFGSGFGSQVRLLTTWDVDGDGPLPERLVVYGVFGGIGAEPVQAFTIWDGSSFHPGLPFYGIVHPSTITSWDPDGQGPQLPTLVAGGSFNSLIYGEPKHIGILDGQQWRNIGAGFDGEVRALTIWDPDGDGPLSPRLVAGGRFYRSGNVVVSGIAIWDGVTWSPLGSGLFSRVSSLTTWDPDGPGPEPSSLIAGGWFRGFPGEFTLNGIARWDGGRWLPLGTGMDGSGVDVVALTTWDPDGDGPSPAHLIAGGGFSSAGGVPALNIARWDGTGWHALGSGLTGGARVLTTWDPDGPGPRAAELVAGGFLTVSGKIPLNYVARWNGSQWRSFGVGLSDYVLSVASWDPDGDGPEAPRLFAGGNFTHAGGQPGAFLAYWSECPPRCLGDFDSDGFIDYFDLDAYFACFEGGACPAGRTADLDGDGFADFFDLSLFLSSYEEGC